jgi:hypothetical protein
MKNTTEHNLKMNDVQGMYVLTDQEIDEISGGSLFTCLRNAVEYGLAFAVGCVVAVLTGSQPLGVVTFGALAHYIPD